MTYCDMSDCIDVDTKCDLDVMKARLQRLNRNMWWVEAATMPKLRTFVQIHDHTNDKILVLKNLNRNQRSLIAKLKGGVLPLHIEIGRYKRSPIEKRVCYMCDAGFLENETHFLYNCPGLANVRNSFKWRVVLPRALEERSLEDILKENLNAEHIKNFGIFLEQMFMERKRLIYEVM